jgi:hypothetical protein
MTEPPSAQEVAQRAVILKQIAMLALSAPPPEVLEGLMEAWSEPQKEEFEGAWEQNVGFLRAAFEDAGVAELLGPLEWDFLQKTPFQWTPQQVVDASWRVEAAAAILWALGVIESLPGYDTRSGHEVLKKIPSGGIGEFVAGASLIARERIERKRAEAERWHWRSRQGVGESDSVVRVVAEESARTGLLDAVVDEDFCAMGKAYRDLRDDEWALVRSITVERHFALNWLCGRAPGNRWEETPTDY